MMEGENGARCSSSSSPEEGEVEVAGFMQKIREAAGRNNKITFIKPMP